MMYKVTLFIGQPRPESRVYTCRADNGPEALAYVRAHCERESELEPVDAIVERFEPTTTEEATEREFLDAASTAGLGEFQAFSHALGLLLRMRSSLQPGELLVFTGKLALTPEPGTGVSETPVRVPFSELAVHCRIAGLPLLALAVFNKGYATKGLRYCGALTWRRHTLREGTAVVTDGLATEVAPVDFVNAVSDFFISAKAGAWTAQYQQDEWRTRFPNWLRYSAALALETPYASLG